jgi:MFS family permease
VSNRRRIGERTAAALVFGASAAVLVVELTALRLLAPYLGLTLETSTLVIGIALGAIAIGAWSGGRAADRIDPRRALAPLLAISGVATALTPAVVRTVAETAPELLSLVCCRPSRRWSPSSC